MCCKLLSPQANPSRSLSTTRMLSMMIIPKALATQTSTVVLFSVLIPAGITVDANRDGAIVFSGEARDITSEIMPFMFWCNDDNDLDTRDVPGSGARDCDDQVIIGRRDLEDMTRLHVFFGGVLQEAVASGQMLIGLKWKRVTDSPSINIFEAAEPDGGTRYLTDEATAIQQAPGVRLRSTVRDINENTRRIAGTTPFILNQNFWTGLSDSNPTSTYSSRVAPKVRAS